MNPIRRAPVLLAVRVTAVVCAALLCGCMYSASGGGSRGSTPAPAADSVTVLLWHLDEKAGTHVGDSGPFKLDGVAGVSARTDFGRLGLARSFERSLDSFVYLPYNPVFEQGSGLTVEAWIYLRAFGPYEDTPIAARWTEEANMRSWLFSVAGERRIPPYAPLPSPGFHFDLVTAPAPGRLLFAFLPEGASQGISHLSITAIELNRWTHVAVTYDGEIVRFYRDGLLDSQYASRGRIRSTPAPLLVANYFDPRRLSRFAGDLRVEQGGDPNPYYALDGLIDELRISTVARTSFEVRPQR